MDFLTSRFLLLGATLLCMGQVSAFFSVSTNHIQPFQLHEATTTTTDVDVPTKSALELSSQIGTAAIFTSEDIDKILPHRYPFALVDRVVSYEAGKSAIGIKSVTKVCTQPFVTVLSYQ